MKVVQVIDVFQCIKHIRAKRPQFVETAVIYSYSINYISLITIVDKKSAANLEEEQFKRPD